MFLVVLYTLRLSRLLWPPGPIARFLLSQYVQRVVLSTNWCQERPRAPVPTLSCRQLCQKEPLNLLSISDISKKKQFTKKAAKSHAMKCIVSIPNYELRCKEIDLEGGCHWANFSFSSCKMHFSGRVLCSTYIKEA